MKKITFAAVVLAAAAMVSCGKKSEEITVESLEKVKVATEFDSLSYATGLTNSAGLKEFLAGYHKIDTTNLDEFYKGMAYFFDKQENQKQKAFYAGLQIAAQIEQMLMQQDYQMSGNDSTKVINRKMFLAGFIDATKDGKTKMNKATAQQDMMRLNEIARKKQQEKQFGSWKKENEAYINQVAKKDSVQKLSEGVYYQVEREGTGAIPADTSLVKVNYEGKLINGEVFDSSYERKEPVTFGVNQVIPGWTEALTHMPVGSKWKIYIAQDKAYGAQQAGPMIKPFSTLVFTVELLEIEK